MMEGVDLGTQLVRDVREAATDCNGVSIDVLCKRFNSVTKQELRHRLDLMLSEVRGCTPTRCAPHHSPTPRVLWLGRV